MGVAGGRLLVKGCGLRVAGNGLAVKRGHVAGKAVSMDPLTKITAQPGWKVTLQQELLQLPLPICRNISQEAHLITLQHSQWNAVAEQHPVTGQAWQSTVRRQ